MVLMGMKVLATTLKADQFLVLFSCATNIPAVMLRKLAVKGSVVLSEVESTVMVGKAYSLVTGSRVKMNW